MPVPTIITTSPTVPNSPSTGGGYYQYIHSDLPNDGSVLVFTRYVPQEQALSDNRRDFDGDIYLRNNTTGEISLVSTDSNGVELDGVSSLSRISADGNYLLFASTSTNVDGANGLFSLYRKNLETSAVEPVLTQDEVGTYGTLTVNPNENVVGNYRSVEYSTEKCVAISGTGRYVAFVLDDVSGDGLYGPRHLYIKDMEQGEITQVADATYFISSGGPLQLSFSSDGRYLMYVENGESPGPESDYSDELDHIYVYDIVAGAVSTTIGLNSIDQAIFSSDGRSVIYSGAHTGDGITQYSFNNPSYAPNSNYATGVFRRDLYSNTTEILTTHTDGEVERGGSYYELATDPAGRYLLFEDRFLTPLVEGDRHSDIVVRDMQTGEMADLSGAYPPGRQAAANAITDLSISSDGRYIYLESETTNGGAEVDLDPAAGDDAPDLFVVQNPLYATPLSVQNGAATATDSRDSITGDSGVDTVTYAGDLADYTIRMMSDGTLRVIDNDDSGNSDILTGIEQLAFDDGTVTVREALTEPTLNTDVLHYAKVQAYFMAILDRAATSAEADQFTDVLQANQSRVWWNSDISSAAGSDSLMGYLMAQSEYATLTNGHTNTEVVSEVFNRLTGEAAPQGLIDQYVGRLEAGTLMTRGIANKMIGELYLSPKGDGSLGAISGFTDNREYLTSDAYCGYLQNLDGIAGIEVQNIDSVVQTVGVQAAEVSV